MNVPPDDEGAHLRWGIYWLLIAVGVGSATGRILAVNSVDFIRLEQNLQKQGRADWQKQRPFLSANDRSRWCTVRALVEHGTYAIDEIVSQPNWDTIDMVKHDEYGQAAPAADEGRLYSSKPPLFATLMAGEYWLIHRATGWTLGDHPFAIGRFMLVTINVVPLVLYFWTLARLAERFGTTDFGRIFMMASATLGTFLSTFAVTINNHLPGAICAAVTVALVVRIVADDERRLRWFALAGLFAALAVTNELPALALFALVAAWLLWYATRETLVAFLPAAAVIGAAALGTNYLAHHTWSPPYAHRKEGDNWYVFQYVRDGKVRDSYWSKTEGRGAVDLGEPSVAKYALHVTVGHHGIFSLTPIWLLSVVGLAMLAFSPDRTARELALVIAALTIVCLTFYIFLRPLEDRNYGGMTSGFRWAFWLAPLWLVALLPAADAMGRRRATQLLAAVLLGFSVMSASYPTWNPWTHPWMLDWFLHMNWVDLGVA